MIPRTADSLLEEAGRCVACGLCLPHCPTYRKTGNEADSPRGRIALMQGGLERRIPMNERYHAHLDLCLGCRACEAVCPNNVAYGGLLAGVRGLAESSRRRGLWRRLARVALVDGLVTKPARLRLAGGLLRAWQASGLPALAQKSTGLAQWSLARIVLRLPRIKPQPVWKAVYPAQGTVRGEVGLFLGCVARVADSDTLRATIFVLNRLGYTVHVPPGQACCGALDASMGRPEKAAGFERENGEAFSGMDVVISTAAGCGATLKGYPQAFAGRVQDVSEFLSAAGGWSEVDIAPLAETVAVHESCLMRNVLRCQDKPYGLLHRIPALAAAPLAGNDQCCGAAGVYALTQPGMAAVLLADKIEAIKASAARIVATSNIGCALHLAAGLKEAGLDVEVVHTVTLLARQMGFDDDKNR
ncbi:MAG: (Fe-S)-binding protein [Sulfuricella sp.]|nr:(Fe-S)-binding protein [Sulfuricella sp.]